MSTLKVGFIGVGRPWRTPGATGFGMNYQHAEGYKALPDMRLAACADISDENAKAFVEKTGTERIYSDYRVMLAKEKLDVLSISTWPDLHAEMVLAGCEAGVKVIHCEKPVADTFGAAKSMAAAAAKHGVRLSFNHQRRFGGIFLEVKKVKASGRLGKLIRMEATPPNLYDWGTHWVDMMQMFNDETPAKCVLAALDIRKGTKVFDLLHEDQALAFIEYRNGVQGLLMCSLGGNPPALRFIGEKGVLEANAWGDNPLRFWKSGPGEAEIIPVTETQDGHVGRAIAEVINSYRENRPCELSADNAMRATEIIFAAYESVRRRGRVDLPLEISDHPLLDMVAAGQLKLAK